MNYIVVTDFTDRIDKHIYRAGDKYPRPGVDVSEERVAELTSTKNMRGEVLIKAVSVPKSAKDRPDEGDTKKADKSVDLQKKKPKKADKKEK
jgi:hypothetical protein